MCIHLHIYIHIVCLQSNILSWLPLHILHHCRKVVACAKSHPVCGELLSFNDMIKTSQKVHRSWLIVVASCMNSFVASPSESAVFCPSWQTDQGIKNLMADRAADLGGSDPDYAQRDLYNAIASGNFPSWTLYIQVMTFEEAEKFRWNPFDLTKVCWQGSLLMQVPSACI